MSPHSILKNKIATKSLSHKISQSAEKEVVVWILYVMVDYLIYSLLKNMLSSSLEFTIQQEKTLR